MIQYMNNFIQSYLQLTAINVFKINRLVDV